MRVATGVDDVPPVDNVLPCRVFNWSETDAPIRKRFFLDRDIVSMAALTAVCVDSLT